jgi:hypothetical protein
MTIEKTDEEWRVIRYKYEHTNQPVAGIARDHQMGPGTLHARARDWGWKPRRAPIPREGPPPMPAPQIEAAAPLLHLAPPPLAPMHAGDAPPPPGAELPGDPNTPAALRLQGAVASVLAAIEAIVAKIGAARLGESDRPARALAALTRTLRELNTLQSQYEEPAADDSPADIDEFRHALAAKIDAFVAAQGGGIRDDAEPQGAGRPRSGLAGVRARSPEAART